MRIIRISMLVDSCLRLFTVADRLVFLTDLNMANGISQFAFLSTHILLLDSYNTLYLYSNCSNPELLLKTTEFKQSLVKIYSLSSSFVILDGYTRQIFELHPTAKLQLQVIHNIEFAHRQLLIDKTHDRSKIFILSDNCSNLAIWNSVDHTIRYHSVQINSKTTITIEKIYALPSTLVFRDSSQQMHLKYLDGMQTTIALERADLFQTAGNRLALFDRSTNQLITYDTEKKLRGEIQLEIPLDALCFTKDGEYLFGISQQESLLLMYQVDSGKLLEKLFIENLSRVLIRATNNRLILSRIDEVILLAINSQFKRYSISSRCLFLIRRILILVRPMNHQ